MKERAQIKQNSLSELSDCFKTFIPGRYLLPAQKGDHNRRRFFSKENTFWAFLSQVLDADGGYQEVVRKPGGGGVENVASAIFVDRRLL